MKGPRAIRMVGLLLALGLLLSILAACTGDPGATGPRGAQGAQGAAGAQGAKGPSGQDGADGRDGASGAAGSAGKTGAKGEKGDQGPQIVAGIMFADPVYSLEGGGSLTLMGWGFQPDETVLITMQTNMRDEIIMGRDANDFGAFEKTNSKFNLAPGLTPGVYTVSAEGTDGTLASTYLVIVQSAK